MKQLGILDSAFINLEQANTPQHIGGFGIYDPSTAPDGKVRFKEVLSSFEARLRKMPVFRTRLVQVPFGLDRPYWVIDEDFDVEYHLQHIALPHPGDWRQLCIKIARLHARPLDMSKPLWECFIIEGLDNIPGLPKGAFAIYTKMHHSLVDGAGGQSFMTALHDLEANPPQSAPQAFEDEELFKPPRFSSLGLLGKAAINNVTSSIGMTKGAFGLARDLVRTGLKIKNSELPVFPTNTPKTRFDNPVGPHRVFDAALFSLDDFKAIRRATGTTVNDVAVAIISGAMRTYLQHHNELPEESLAVAMPVNTRERKEVTDDNNQVSAIITRIHTEIADPLQRLQAIGNSTDDAKNFIDTPLSDPMKIPGIFNPVISKNISKWYVKRKFTRNMPVGTSGVITNVMGPPFPLYSAGARLVRYYCLGLLTAGGGLFHAVFSMDGTVSVSVLSDRDIMPDPDFYKQCIVDSFEELKKAVEDKEKSVKTSVVKKSSGAKKTAVPVKRKVAAKARAEGKPVFEKAAGKTTDSSSGEKTASKKNVKKKADAKVKVGAKDKVSAKEKVDAKEEVDVKEKLDVKENVEVKKKVSAKVKETEPSPAPVSRIELPEQSVNE